VAQVKWTANLRLARPLLALQELTQPLVSGPKTQVNDLKIQREQKENQDNFDFLETEDMIL